MSKSITILYIEDEEQIRENTQRPLGYLCDELLVASDGVQGLELYKSSTPDIVVSDIKMPNMNGVDMCRIIKEINPNQHIIFTTAHNESGYFIDAIDMQVDGYILKPIDYDLLEKKIVNIIKQINLESMLEEQKVLTKNIAKLQDNLLVVLDKKYNMIFSNDDFLDFFHIDDLSKFRQKHNKLASLFLEYDEFFIPTSTADRDWIEEIQNLDKSQRMVSLWNINLSASQSFLASIKSIEETGHTIITFTEITNITAEAIEFKHKAFTDELTGIYNRAYFNEKISQQISSSQKEKIPFCIIILDIDKFKDFNDTYGHQLGDEVLKELTAIISKHTRDVDTFARWGGEEFVKIIVHSSVDETIKIAEFLRKEIQNHNFVDGLKVTCSFGISQYRDNDTEESLIKRADEALYRAKKHGRNRVESQI